MKQWNVLGLMSGSSLDGMDVAQCKFTSNDDGQAFQLIDWSIESGVTYAFSDSWKEQLQNAGALSSQDLIQLDRRLGVYTAEIILDFCGRTGVKPEFAALHGHTIFHEPTKGYTLQIGHAGITAAKAQMTTIGDFRSSDIALGGQGAPFAPIVDQFCFPEYDIIFNLGGIANVTILKNGLVTNAYDLGPCNQILNYFSQKLGQQYDSEGEIAKSTSADSDLLNSLDQWYYYKLPPPKSLSNQQVMNEFLAIFPNDISPSTAIATMTQHLANKIINCVNSIDIITPKVLLSGGGGHNSYLVALIKSGCQKTEIKVPEKILVDYKECLLMALMGLLRINETNNVLKIVTGASKDHCAGAVYFHEKSST